MPWSDDKTNPFLQEDQPYFNWSSYQPAGEMQPTGDQNYGITDYLKNDFDWSSLPRDLLNIPVDSKWSLHQGMDDPLVQKMVAQGMSGLVPGGEGTGIVLGPGGKALKSYAQIAKDAPYRSWLTKFLHNPNVVIPYLPKSYSEPLVAKTVGEDLAPLTKAMGKPQWSKNLGFHTELPRGGSLIASTVNNQERTLPHEFGHFLQKIWRNNAINEGWMGKEAYPLLSNYEKEADQLFNELETPLKTNILRNWRGAGYSRKNFMNELVADLVRPQTFTERWPKTLASLAEAGKGPFLSTPIINEEYPLGLLKLDLANKYPTLGAFWDDVPTRIPSSAYDLPKGWE